MDKIFIRTKVDELLLIISKASMELASIRERCMHPEKKVAMPSHEIQVVCEICGHCLGFPSTAKDRAAAEEMLKDAYWPPR